MEEHKRRQCHLTLRPPPFRLSLLLPPLPAPAARGQAERTSEWEEEDDAEGECYEAVSSFPSTPQPCRRRRRRQRAARAERSQGAGALLRRWEDDRRSLLIKCGWGGVGRCSARGTSPRRRLLTSAAHPLPKAGRHPPIQHLPYRDCTDRAPRSAATDGALLPEDQCTRLAMV